MINIENPGTVDLYIPRSDSAGGGGKAFGRKDIETILAGYVTKAEFNQEIARLEALIETLTQ